MRGCVQRQGTQQGIAQAWRWSLVVQRRQREGLPHVRSCLMHADMRAQAAVESLVLHYFAHHTDTTWQTTRCMTSSIPDLTAPCRTVWCASFVEKILISNILWHLPVDDAFSWIDETTENKRDSECWDVRLYFTSPRCIRTEGFADDHTSRDEESICSATESFLCGVLSLPDPLATVRQKLEMIRTDDEYTCGGNGYAYLIRVTSERLIIGAVVFFFFPRSGHSLAQTNGFCRTSPPSN